MSNGKQGEMLFSQQMTERGYKVQDVSNNPDYWHKDIDFIITSPTTNKVKTFEVKWDSRINKTGNLYLELTNVHSKGGLGWFKFCQADYVAYGDAQAKVFYVIPLEELRAHLKHVSGRITNCGTDSTGLLVKLKDIEDLVYTV